jgi:hypothetical protein
MNKMNTTTIKIDGARKVGAMIHAYTRTGGRFILKHRFAYRDCPELGNTLRAIRDRGVIDMRYWRVAGRGES